MTLRGLSLLNKQIRKEVHTFFYANNRFEFSFFRYATDSDAAYLKACAHFLEHMGADGRASLTSLRLYDGHIPPYYNLTKHYPKDIASLFRRLHQCTNLATLSMNNFLVLGPTKLKLCLLGGSDDKKLEEALESLADRFRAFPHLEVLRLSHFKSIIHVRRSRRGPWLIYGLDQLLEFMYDVERVLSDAIETEIQIR